MRSSVRSSGCTDAGRFREGSPPYMTTAELMEILTEFHGSLPAEEDLQVAA